MSRSDDSADSFDPNGLRDDGDFDAPLDEEFQLDGAADIEAMVACPYCGEVVAIALDPGGGSVQDYVEDCEVCCQPWAVSVSYQDGRAAVSVRPLDS